MQQQTGTIDNLTTHEFQVLESVKEYMKQFDGVNQEWFTDQYLLRFCRARKFDLEQIKIMLKNHVEWLIKHKIEELGKLDLTQYEFLWQNSFVGYCNTDKQGWPVYIERISHLKANEIFNKYTDEQLIQYYIQSYERQLSIIFPECSKAKGEVVERTVTILDVKDVSYMKMFTGQVKHFLQLTIGITSNNYPETLGEMYIINSGMLFSIVWSFVKHIIDPVTASKIKIISGSGKSELLKIVDKENLPKFLGGEASDDIKGNPGVWQPELQNSIAEKRIKHSDQNLFQRFFSKKAQPTTS